MQHAHVDLSGLTQLHRLDRIEEIRALWRRSMATLAAVSLDQQPVPLEGFPPEALLESVHVALDRGLLDDLSWLSPAAAAVAVFELASALPRSQQKHELGRRVLTALHQGNAETFVAVATALALSSRRGLSGEHVRSRVALSLRLPVGLGTRADALALALISRPDVERDWLSEPSTGALPSRRLAARLLERAAREAARRAGNGDDTGVRVFDTRPVRAAMARLLDDRESLVWRHVAAARGLLAHAIADCGDAIERGLDPSLGPTEWRRAAASLGASVAIDPVGAAQRARALLSGGVIEQDRGIAGTLLFGLSSAAESEREAAEALLDEVVSGGEAGLHIYTVEALVDLRREHVGSDFGLRAATMARGALRDADPSEDDGLGALIRALHDELAAEPTKSTAHHLRHRLEAALRAFAERGAYAAQRATHRALAAAKATMSALEAASGNSPEDRLRAFRALRELDRGLLETSTLRDLLTIMSPPEEDTAGVQMSELLGRLTRWLLARESRPLDANNIPHLTWRLRRVRTLLHLVDAGDDANSSVVRQRHLDTMRVLLRRVSGDTFSRLHRTVCAALARNCDALVREEVCELSDVLMAVMVGVQSDGDLDILAEASMMPELKAILEAHARTARVAGEALQTYPPDADKVAELVVALLAVAEAIPPAWSPRVEALHGAWLKIARSLAVLAGARSLHDTLGGDGASAGAGQPADGSPFVQLGDGTRRLAQLVAGAMHRTGTRIEAARPDAAASPELAMGVVESAAERALAGDTNRLEPAIARASDAVRAALPPGIADAIALVLARVLTLPLEPSSEPPLVIEPPRSERAATEPPVGVGKADAARAVPGTRIAPWLPPTRTLGGFYVLRTIGKGAVGSVFAACRAEQRHEEAPQRFALKVPEYSGAAAHTLSEAEFLRLFREEASALLALPEHPNLARFITFDVGVEPKPILVMEMVEGPTLERVLDREECTVPRALAILDGVAAGLSAMHAVGVGHLDVKPSNIILRDAAPGVNASASAPGGEHPVLVDFGLAGRNIRPGCATVHYGAPEIWSEKLLDGGSRPAPADVYAFACLAFEALTADVLVDGDTATGVMAVHLSHDGMPPKLEELAEHPEYRPLAELLSRGLRRRQPDRASIDELRDGLRELAPTLGEHAWPL